LRLNGFLPRKSSAFTKGILDWRTENTEKKFATGPRGNTVWGRADWVAKKGAVVEFG
jgi:hypothetical protein